MTTTTFHNVYRMGRCQTAAGKLPRVTRAAADRAVHAAMPRVGIWHVHDHEPTISALCGRWGRM